MNSPIIHRVSDIVYCYLSDFLIVNKYDVNLLIFSRNYIFKLVK